MTELVIIGILAGLLALQMLLSYFMWRKYQDILELWAQKVMAKTYRDYQEHLLGVEKLKAEGKKAKKGKESIEGEGLKEKMHYDYHSGDI